VLLDDGYGTSATTEILATPEGRFSKMLRQKDDSQRAAPEGRCGRGQNDDTPKRLAPSEEQVDGEMGNGEQCAKGRGHPFQPLHDLLVLMHTAFQLREAAWLSVAQELLHLALKNIQVGQDLTFKVGHLAAPCVAMLRYGL
jgi:hypothetical protein